MCEPNYGHGSVTTAIVKGEGMEEKNKRQNNDDGDEAKEAPPGSMFL